MAARLPVVRISGKFRALPSGDWVPVSAGGTGATSAGAALSNLGGQPLHANLTALSGLAGAANKMFYFTAAGAMALADLTVFARSWNALADAPAGRTLLGLGTAATRDATTSATDTTSEKLWRTNDLVKQTSTTDSGAGKVLIQGAWGNGGQVVATDPDMNNYLTGGKFITPSVGLLNLPAGWISSRYLMDVVGGPSYAAQTLHKTFGTGVATRTWNGAVWSTWLELWHNGNIDPAPKANPIFTGVAQFDTLRPVLQISYEADNYGAAWARGLFYQDAGVIQGGFCAFGSAGAVSQLHMGWGASPWGSTVRISMNGSGTAIYGPTTVNDYIKLGSDAPAIKMKKYTGTTAGVQGEGVSLAHGLTASKILSCDLAIYDNTNNYYVPHSYQGIAGHHAVVHWDTTYIYVSNIFGASGGILSKTFKLVVTYEE